MSRWVRVDVSVLEDEFFGREPFGKIHAFLWLSQVWDGKDHHMVAARIRWPAQDLWKFVRRLIRDGMVSGPAIEELEVFYRKRARRSAIPTSIKDAVSRRDGEKCRYCGDASGPFHFDHVHPWSKGGEHRSSNLVVSCQTCNLTKKDKTLRELGWKL